MSSPFPGMDPFLEVCGVWPDFHMTFLVLLRRQLNHCLPKGFVASAEERIYIVPEEREIRPDVTVFAVSSGAPRPSRGVALAERAVEPERVRGGHGQVVERFLEIRDVGASGREVVMTIELLSPANKRLGSEGRAEYVRRQKSVLSSPTHLLELDFLRGGEHTLFVPKREVEALGSFDYRLALADRNDRAEDCFWLLSLRESLPVIRLPLTPPVEPIFVDLQEVFEQTWADSRYEQTLDYSTPLFPPLSLEDEIWVSERLKGLL